MTKEAPTIISEITGAGDDNIKEFILSPGDSYGF
jgi:hypothetical protein